MIFYVGVLVYSFVVNFWFAQIVKYSDNVFLSILQHFLIYLLIFGGFLVLIIIFLYFFSDYVYCMDDLVKDQSSVVNKSTSALEGNYTYNKVEGSHQANIKVDQQTVNTATGAFLEVVSNGTGVLLGGAGITALVPPILKSLPASMPVGGKIAAGALTIITGGAAGVIGGRAGQAISNNIWVNRSHAAGHDYHEGIPSPTDSQFNSPLEGIDNLFYSGSPLENLIYIQFSLNV